MIEYIQGELAECTPAVAVVDNHGMGYLLNISLNTYTAIQNSNQVKLYVYEAIREDAHILYGFSEKQERDLFLLLITVPGIGGNTARMILSALNPVELCNAIAAGDEHLLKTIKGIGLKTAQRIIVDLKNKIQGVIPDAASTSASAVMLLHNEVAEGAVAALVMLGFPQAVSGKTVLSILKENPTAPVEQVIKTALKML